MAKIRLIISGAGMIKTVIINSLPFFLWQLGCLESSPPPWDCEVSILPLCYSVWLITIRVKGNCTTYLKMSLPEHTIDVSHLIYMANIRLIISAAGMIKTLIISSLPFFPVADTVAGIKLGIVR